MIITKTPLRVSFLGGGTDFPEYFEEHGGAVLATAIDKYAFITVTKLKDFFSHKLRISYSKVESVTEVDEIQHVVFKHALKMMNIPSLIEVNHIADLPARTGLGSSSSLSVCLLHALYAYKNIYVDNNKLAMDAIHLERDILNEYVGCQDQTLAAVGGFKFIEFYSSKDIRCTPVLISNEKKSILNSSLMMFFTGMVRSASEISEEQVKRTSINIPYLNQLKNLAYEGKKEIEKTDLDLKGFGRILHEGWQLKKSLSSKISNSTIDDIYNLGLENGAYGGKLLGAGSGGFILFLVPNERKEHMRKIMAPLKEVTFNFEPAGSQIIYYSP